MTLMRHELDNGLTIVAEPNPAAKSLAFGFFVRTGARDETPDVSGVSHFLEHMVFKGTDTYQADDVNRIFDEIGAQYNASTSEEITLFHAAILPEYFDPAFELMSGIMRPALRASDFDMEKNVILEEIGMYDDQPSFMAYDKGMQSHFAGHPLGLPILGTNESITALTVEQMREYFQRNYTAGNITLAVCGNLDWDRLRRAAEECCGSWPAGTASRITEEPRPPATRVTVTKAAVNQSHVMQFAAAPAAADESRFAAEMLTVVVGDDSNSRMYWDLVDPGDAEAAEMGYNEYDGCGTYMTYLCSSPEALEGNLSRIATIQDQVNREGISDLELAQAKSKVASRLVLRSERPMGRLSSVGNNWAYRREYRSIEDDLQTLGKVTTDQISELLNEYPLAGTTTVIVGPE